MKPLLFIILSCFSINSLAQDDLLNLLKADTPVKKQAVIATFKGSKIINVETNETARKGNLDFRVSHLFGNVGRESGGGVHNLYGIHQSADIRIGFHYGLSDRLMLGISTLKRNENFEGLAKFRVFEQLTDNRLPFALTLYANTTYTIRESTLYTRDIHRFTYCSQAVFARKFSSDFSIVIIPGILHRNFVTRDDDNTTFNLSGGFRFKFTRSTSIVADYAHTFGRSEFIPERFDVFGGGVEIETGGHVFSIMFTNASGVLENDFLVNTNDSWEKGGFKFSFIISRMFALRKVVN